MNNTSDDKIKTLIQQGVKIYNPESIYISDDVNTDNISGNGVSIYSGCKIKGNSTVILDGAEIGSEGPVTIDNCQIGPKVNLANGFFKESVLLKQVSVGSGAHIREGTILEEQVSVAHTVGLKQTILFPFVTLGSLINFCDCLMCGGTSQKNHSEVGSSYIHFNFTPNQDKATASLFGNVPEGVMLNQKPIFLGGHGGIVGPVRLSFGTVIAAGSIYRKDELRPGRLLIEGKRKGGSIPYSTGVYRNLKRVVLNNLIYIANLLALMQWYKHVRSQFISHDFPESMLSGLKDKLNLAIDERIYRLKELSDKVSEVYLDSLEKTTTSHVSLLFKQQDELSKKWPDVCNLYKKMQTFEGNEILRDSFLSDLLKAIKVSGKDYILAIQSLNKKEHNKGSGWLKGIVNDIINNVLKIIPSFADKKSFDMK